MLKVGDIFFVGTKGICKLKDIKLNAFVGANKDLEYYVFEPVDSLSNMQVYLPVNTKVNIRNLISKKDAEKSFETFNNIDEIDIDKESERFDKYCEILNVGNFFGWLKLLKTLIKRKDILPRKQFNQLEQKYLQTTKGCVVSEISVVLGISKEQVCQSLNISSCLI